MTITFNNACIEILKNIVKIEKENQTILNLSLLIYIY